MVLLEHSPAAILPGVKPIPQPVSWTCMPSRLKGPILGTEGEQLRFDGSAVLVKHRKTPRVS